ncbi:hypothetical protein [Pyrococcus sp. ST04]|uniref:hypothetical protein n=1 Tax=Pyrococcus sp. ST04 TaxID=1183377 RepID=UPI0002605C2F|nr:hypothetical protein [Pyrococcus sp. ST04]AFK22355.1 hypothetical protein Py04_0754 [Pyrococcus sp. ST04]
MRLIKSLVLFFLVLPAIMWMNYVRYHEKIQVAGPYPIVYTSENSTYYYLISLFVPTWSLAEIECNGKATIVVEDLNTESVILKKRFHGKLILQFEFPHEGSYIVYSKEATPPTSCIIRLRENLPSQDVQRVMYTVGLISGIILVGILRRW